MDLSSSSELLDVSEIQGAYRVKAVLVLERLTGQISTLCKYAVTEFSKRKRHFDSRGTLSRETDYICPGSSMVRAAGG